MGRPAAFLDRDGTIIREADYLRSAKRLRLLEGAADAVRALGEAGFAVVVVTNQSGVARGLLTEQDLQSIHEELRRRLARQGARLDAIYYCPHHPTGQVAEYRKVCRCRKPGPGLLERAASELGLDLARSFAIGDSERDVEAGRRAGCRTVLVRTGYGAVVEARWSKGASPDHVADDLAAAAAWVLKQTDRPAPGL
jgi:D-glycero-D-manno-heptose 1,7-bisphosphate phosphatase